MDGVSKTLPAVLTIAGSDSSGGAGIQADLKTMAAFGVFGMSAITSLTAQNTLGVTDVMDASPAFLARQIDAVFDDIEPDAVKIGMVSNSALVEVIAERLQARGARNIVLDPVMVATSGATLMRSDARKALVEHLLPLATLVTPNIAEACALSGIQIEDEAGMEKAARVIADMTEGAVLVKGGHLITDAPARDLLLAQGEVRWFSAPAIDTVNTHGTGCTLSSAIASCLALRMDLPQAVEVAKGYLTDCLSVGLDLGQGSGPLDHMARLRPVVHTSFAPVRRVVGSLSDYTLVVGGAPRLLPATLLEALTSGADRIIAADGGALHLARLGRQPDKLVGDLDSVDATLLASVESGGVDVLDVPREKDFTDLELALETAWALGGRRCVVCGVSGGRIDHELAVYGACAKYASRMEVSILESDRVVAFLSADGGEGRMEGEDDASRSLSCTLSSLGLLPGDRFSVLALGKAWVTEKGVAFETRDLELPPLDPRGVSNVVNDGGATVEVRKGCIAVVAAAGK